MGLFPLFHRSQECAPYPSQLLATNILCPRHPWISSHDLRLPRLWQCFQSASHTCVFSLVGSPHFGDPSLWITRLGVGISDVPLLPALPSHDLLPWLQPHCAPFPQLWASPSYSHAKSRNSPWAEPWTPWLPRRGRQLQTWKWTPEEAQHTVNPWSSRPGSPTWKCNWVIYYTKSVILDKCINLL